MVEYSKMVKVQQALAIFKRFLTSENYESYRRTNLECGKILRHNKRQRWKNLCQQFNFKTLTSQVWKFIKVYKNKKLYANTLNADPQAEILLQEKVVDKLCRPSWSWFCLRLAPTVARAVGGGATNISGVDGFSIWEITQEITQAFKTLKKNSALELDQIDNRMLFILPKGFAGFFSIYNAMYLKVVYIRRSGKSLW